VNAVNAVTVVIVAIVAEVAVEAVDSEATGEVIAEAIVVETRAPRRRTIMTDDAEAPPVAVSATFTSQAIMTVVPMVVTAIAIDLATGPASAVILVDDQ
jgi:hypothetical protein